MTKTDASANLPRFLMLASIGVVLAGLYFAQEVLIPLALAALLSFLLAPLVKRLERLYLPRSAAVIVTVLFAFAVLVGIGWVVFNQIGELKSGMASYQQNIQHKVDSMRGPGGVLSWVKTAGAEVKKVLNSGPATEPVSAPPVRIVNPDSSTSQGSDSPLDILRPIGAFLLGPLGTAFIVTVFAIFMLLQREDLRDRLIRLIGRNQLTLTTQALDDAAERVSRYLLMQSIVNGSVGVVVMITLWTIGKINGQPFPAVALWGLLTALLRFIPYVGIWISSVSPILLSLAVYPHSRVAFEVFMSYGTIEVIAANMLEPMLYGSSTGIATLAVLVAAAFWTWLWGPVGLLLSTPLTVCLVVMGKYVPQLEFLTILLAEEPALAPPDRVYQRLLAVDREDAADLVDEYAAKMPLEELYEKVLTPALMMSDRDAEIGNINKEQHANIRKGVRDIVEDLGDRAKAAAQPEVKNATGKVEGTRILLPAGCKVSVVFLPANDESDEIAGLMFAQLLELRGYCVVLVSSSQLASEMVQTVTDNSADLVCISALPPAAVTHARYLIKRLQGKLANIEMLVGIWSPDSDIQKVRDRVSASGTAHITTSFSDAVQQVHQLVQPKLIEPSHPQA